MKWHFGIPKNKVLGLLLFVSFFFLSCSDLQYKKQPVTDFIVYPFKFQKKFVIEKSLPNAILYPVDIDGDGNDEFIRIYNNPNDLSMVILRTFKRTTIEAINDTAIFGYIGKIDYNQDGIYELLLNAQKKDRFELILLPTSTNQAVKKWEVCKKKEIFKSQKGRIYIGGAFFHPLDSYKIFLILNTAFTDAPRHILLYDLQKTNIEFDVHIAPIIQNVCTGKFVPGSAYQLLIGTYASGNGAYYAGMDDYHSWFIVLDLDGKILYKKQYGEFGSFVWISPQPFVDNSGNQNVFIVRSHYGEKQSEPDFVGIWSWNHRDNIRKISFPQGIVTNQILEVKNLASGKQEVIFLRKDGAIISVDEDLKITRFKVLDFLLNPEETGFILAANLVGDYRNEYVLYDRKFSYILSERFRLLYRTPDQIMPKAVHFTDQSHALLIHRDRDNVFYLSGVTLNNMYYYFRIGIVGVVMGIVILVAIIQSKRKKMRELIGIYQKNAFRAWVLEHMDVGVVLLDKFGKIHLINRKARELLRLPLEILDTIDSLKTAVQVINNERLKYLFDVVRALENTSQKTVRREHELKEEDETVRLMITGEILTDEEGKFLGKAILLKDITKSVQERELLAWTEFASKLAHEVKTPLASMLLATEKIHKIVEHMNDVNVADNRKKIQKYIQFLFTEFDHLQSISESLMQLTILSKKEIKKININRIIRECIEKLQLATLKKINLDLKFTEDIPKIEGDLNHLSLAIMNILKNSIEAVQEGDTIHISTYLAHGLHNGKYPQVEFVVIEIADNGMGIPEAIKEKIFEPYFSNKERGTGLGLPIARKIVRDHYGEIFFDSQENVGTTFWIYLPVSQNKISEMFYEA